MMMRGMIMMPVVVMHQSGQVLGRVNRITGRRRSGSRGQGGGGRQRQLVKGSRRRLATATTATAGHRVILLLKLLCLLLHQMVQVHLMQVCGCDDRRFALILGIHDAGRRGLGSNAAAVTAVIMVLMLWLTRRRCRLLVVRVIDRGSCQVSKVEVLLPTIHRIGDGCESSGGGHGIRLDQHTDGVCETSMMRSQKMSGEKMQVAKKKAKEGIFW